ncbi:MAG: hypothetical protein AAGF59_07570 [Pseudomonadota bacterium]
MTTLAIPGGALDRRVLIPSLAILALSLHKWIHKDFVEETPKSRFVRPMPHVA